MADEERGGPDPSLPAPDHPTGVPGSPGLSDDMERVLAHLAEQPTPHDLRAPCPDPTWEDVRAVMAQLPSRAGDVGGERTLEVETPAFVTPREFYAEMTRRTDVREVLRRLAE